MSLFSLLFCCLNISSSSGKIIAPRWDRHEYLCCFIHPKLWGSKLGVSLHTALAEELHLPKWSARLTITPYITLVRVRSVQDWFKSHPFNGYLWNRNRWFNIYQISQRFPENTLKPGEKEALEECFYLCEEPDWLLAPHFCKCALTDNFITS